MLPALRARLDRIDIDRRVHDLAVALVERADAVGDHPRVRDPGIDAPCHLAIGLSQSRQQLAHCWLQQRRHLVAQVVLARVPQVARRRMAVRHLDGARVEAQSFDEGTGRHDDDIDVARDA